MRKFFYIILPLISLLFLNTSFAGSELLKFSPGAKQQQCVQQAFAQEKISSDDQKSVAGVFADSTLATQIQKLCKTSVLTPTADKCCCKSPDGRYCRCYTKKNKSCFWCRASGACTGPHCKVKKKPANADRQ